MKVPNWIEVALKEIGETEIQGGENPRILEYLRATDLGKPGNLEDETPWCSGFVNWCMQQVGFKGTRSAWAQSWAKWGKEVEPVIGSIVVFRWNNGTGHVGFVTGKKVGLVQVLGGNQSDSVNRSWFNTAHVIAYRMPAFTPVQYVDLDLDGDESQDGSESDTR
jgi:uncharacterized protein (TIGR02594 family)